MKARSVKPGLNLEYVMWIFTRVSGLGMFLLAATGVTAAFILGARTQMDMPTLLRWTFFPNPNHVINSEIPDIALGWANAFWQVMQILLVFFGVTHGLNGLRVVIEEFVDRSFWQLLLRGLIFSLWLFILIVAVYVILAS